VNLSGKNVRIHILTSLFTALTAVGAFVRIPIGYVPFTLQDFFVILSGSVLGAYFGALSQMLYLVIGLLGVPVFSQGGGPGYIVQPTFGYLLGFPVASFVIGKLVWGRQRYPQTPPPPLPRIIAANATGVLVIFIFGLAYLYLNMKYIVGKPLSLSQTVWAGFILFIPGSLLKIVVSSLISPKLSRLLTRTGEQSRSMNSS
jgi:biotin transport system substrate-specific component